MRRREHALQRVTGNAEGLPMVGQQIMEALGGVVDAVPCIQLQLANGPIPDAREVPQPVGELAFLRAVRRSLSCRWITLHPFLVLDVLLDDFEWRTTNGRDKVGVGPERGQSGPEPGIFLAQET